MVLSAKRNGLTYSILVFIVMMLGLSSRRFSYYMPNWLNLYLGDTLWALMIFFFFGLLFRHRETRWVTAIALLFSFAIEFSQLYHAQWIDSLRKTRIGGLILGYGFLWSDLVSYTVGIGLGMLFEKLMFRRNKRSKR